MQKQMNPKRIMVCEKSETQKAYDSTYMTFWNRQIHRIDESGTGGTGWG